MPGLLEAVSRRPTKGRTPLQIQVRYEPGRGSGEVMAHNYERIVPIGRRPLHAGVLEGISAPERKEAAESSGREGVA